MRGGCRLWILMDSSHVSGNGRPLPAASSLRQWLHEIDLRLIDKVSRANKIINHATLPVIATHNAQTARAAMDMFPITVLEGQIPVMVDKGTGFTIDISSHAKLPTKHRNVFGTTCV